MSIRLNGKPSTVLSFTGAQIVLTAESPSPPGARLEVEVDDEAGAPQAFRVKVHGCKRIPTGFMVLGGLMDLRKEGRSALEALTRREGTPATVKGFS
ncbi:MAG: hypothetical protein IPJ34_41735 [Myxococcales bacterium]|nr:hypothetical protein [Myxococcales bacterium]